MKILVAISNVPDTTSKIQFTDGDTKFNAAGVTFIVNPYDEWYALVRALELKEAGLAEKVTILHVGLLDSEATIRKGLALGADEAVRVDADAPDALFVAEQVAAYAKANNFDLIMVGKETINYNGASVGAMIAGLNDLPFISMAIKLDLAGNKVTAEQDTDDGAQIVECDLPLVVSCAKGMAEQRIPNMRGIMAARTKPLTVIASNGSAASTSVKSFVVNPGRTTCKMLGEDSMDELVQLLHTEAKVI